MIKIEALRARPDDFYRPYLDITVVVGKQRSVQVTAGLDSGADRSLFPVSFVEALGVDVDKLPEAKRKDGSPMPGGGVGGEFEMKECRGKLRWRQWKFADRFWVGPDGTPWPLIGRDDFFARFDVHFYWSEAPPVFEIERI